MKEPEALRDPCPYNNMVECQEGGEKCAGCGWNPKAAERRVVRWKQYKSVRKEADNHARDT